MVGLEITLTLLSTFVASSAIPVANLTADEVTVVVAKVAGDYTGPPNIQKTPGWLCTPDDPHYEGNGDIGVPKCKRAVATAEKKQVAAYYGVTDKSTWPDYEFDHLIPLGIGGSSDPKNLWPQLRGDEQKLKDKIEDQAYNKLKNGEVTQQQAIQLIWDNLQSAYGVTYTCYDNDCMTSSQSGGDGGSTGGDGGSTGGDGGSTGGDGGSTGGGDGGDGGNTPATTCSHDLCTTGVKLDKDCDPCVAKIYAKDSYCSETKWSYICVNEVSSVCGLTTCPCGTDCAPLTLALSNLTIASAA